MDTRDFLKLIVAESQEPNTDKCRTLVGTHGHKLKSKKDLERYAHLSDSGIDNMTETEVQYHLVLFIMDRFKQR